MKRPNERFYRGKEKGIRVLVAFEKYIYLEMVGGAGPYFKESNGWKVSCDFEIQNFKFVGYSCTWTA